MRVIKIFLASSEELEYDRLVFGNLIRRLDDIYEKRGIRLKLFEWEDYDAAFNDRRKQDEYNDKVRESDIFLALFHKKAGEFTIEEFDVASKSYKEHSSPKVYTYIKDLTPGDTASQELEDFKRHLFDEMGHYWCHYDSRDSLQFQFVMQLQLVESVTEGDLEVEEGVISIDGKKVASMEKLQFAAGNEDYSKMCEELNSLPSKIEKARLRLEKFPDDDDLKDDLRQKVEQYKYLRAKRIEYEHALLDTAKKITAIQDKRVTDRMIRAMNAFNEGKIRDAIIILNEAERDAEYNLESYMKSKEMTALTKANVITSIGELQLKASTIMVDERMPVETRVDKVDSLFDQAVVMAEAIEMEAQEYADLLFDHGHYLSHYAIYTMKEDHLKKALQIQKKVLAIRLELFGNNHDSVALSYMEIGHVYRNLGDFPYSFENYENALKILVEIHGELFPDVAFIYDKISRLYADQDRFNDAIKMERRSVHIINNIYGEDSEQAGKISYYYYYLGVLYYRIGSFQEALDYLNKSLMIRERYTGKLDPWTLETIGKIYKQNKDYSKALPYYEKAFMVREKDDPLKENLLTVFAEEDLIELRQNIALA